MSEAHEYHFPEWIGRQEQATELISSVPAALLAATLDRAEPAPDAGNALPPLSHWLHFLPRARHSAVGTDGHPRRGGFLPPISLPRRMWAGGQLEFRRPLVAGSEVTRTSTIQAIRSKSGRSGQLVLVTVRHDLADQTGLLLSETQDIVYRDAPMANDPAPAPRAAPDGAQFEREVRSDPVLLFRFSALTFNGHRIHYDRPYATNEEGYPGLVVQGPLIATLLVDLLRRSLPDARLLSFRFRAVSPLIDTAPFCVCGKRDGSDVTLWARNSTGHLAMEAQATIG